MTMNNTKGHGYFRKKKWAKGLVSGIAITGAVVFSSGAVFADETTSSAPIEPQPVVTQPESTNDNNVYAAQANTSTGTQTVVIDNSTVEAAAQTATEIGVAVTKEATVDQGTDTNTVDLNASKSEIKADQDQQIKKIEAATQTQADNNAAYNEAQAAIDANNDFVEDATAKHEKDTRVTVTTDNSTATDGSAAKNKQAVETAKKILTTNQTAVQTYIGEKAVYDATVAQATTLNHAVEAATLELKNKGVTVTTTAKVVSTVAEVKALRKQNEEAIATANQQVTLNTAILAAYDKTKQASDATNTDADKKSDELKGSGVTVTSSSTEVSSAEEAESIASQNQSAYDQAKQKQADWQKKYDELKAKTGTEGYTKEVVLQAVDLAAANPQARHGSSAAGATVVGTRDIASSSGRSGYARILDSTGVIKYANVGAGWTTEIDYTNLKGLTVTTADGHKHDISRIHRTFRLVNNGATGLNDVYIPNDPTEGFIVARNNGTDSYSDFMNFLVTDNYYYTANGKEVAFTATEKTPLALTYSSLNNNQIGREGARATGNGSKMVEINGSTASIHSDQFAYSNHYNRQEETGVNWDTTDSPYQYKGSAIGVFTQGTAFTTEFVQWDGPADSGGQTYWFAINTKVVSPVVQVPASATIVKTRVKPVSVEPVSAQLVKAVNPEKPKLELTKLADTRNQQVSVSYHDYKLSYKPTVTKTVTDTDKKNTDGATVVKNTPQVYTLNHDNIYGNIKVGDTITIVDPLEAGAVPLVEDNAADARTKGWTVSYDDTKATYTYTATYQGKKLAAPTIKWTPIYDKGFFDNTYKVFKNDYEAFSNTVTNYTPEPPKPVKSITDNSGADINGAKTFDRNVNFHVTTDYSPYTTVTASSEAILKGFAILDDVQDGAFTVNEDAIMATATDGTNVKDLFTMYHVLSDEARTDALQAILDQAGLSPVGEFYLWVAKDPASFYANYVKQAKNVTIDLPARLLIPEGEVVKNDFFQIDFGNSYQSNLVTVQVPDVHPEKHALDQKDDPIILDDQTVQIGDYIRYLLDGVTVPVKHDTLWQYDGKDKLDIAHDRYTGNWKGIIKGTEYTAKEDLVLTYDVTLEDGTLIKAGDTIKAGSKYAFTFEFDQDTNSDFIKKMVTVTWDKEKGEWAYTIDKSFLNSLGVEGTFDADFYIEVERIAAGDVENTFINIVNGKEMTAKVTTHTPAPPQPTPPAPNTPAKPANMLPSTGEASSRLAILGGILLSGLGFIGIRKRKEN